MTTLYTNHVGAVSEAHMTANSGETPAQRIARVFEAAAVARALGDLAGKHQFQHNTDSEWHAEKPICKAGA